MWGQSHSHYQPEELIFRPNRPVRSSGTWPDWGLENQQRINYAMPLRHIVGDALGYLKEYSEIAKQNKADGHWDSPDEFLSGFRKEDRLHPMVTLCVY